MIDTTIIFNDPQYEGYCKYVSNYSSQWKDLYQEFALEILTKKHNVTTNVENYCKSIIYKTWRRMTGYGHCSKSEAMRLSNYADRSVEITDRLITDEIIPDASEAVEELDKLLKSEHKKIKRKAEITQEFINGTNRLQISKARGINYRIAHSSVEDTLKTIKTNMTKNEIKESLLAQGISASYSGKDKTFYTSKKPSQELEAKIIKAGFKAQDKK